MSLIRSIRFGLATGSVVSLLVTLTVTVWEWLENPGGIFRQTEGTNWHFVLETAMSWLIPTFAVTVGVALSSHLILTAIRRVAAKQRGAAKAGAGKERG